MTAPFVMLVDDEVDFVEAMIQRLEQRKIETIAAFSGEECLAALKTHKIIDVIVLDVKMPGMDGIETLKEIKKISPETEVIMLTGHATVQSGIEGMELGAYDYLMKPCKIEELVLKVDKATRKKRAREKESHELSDLMETSTVEQLMVPIAEYATVSEDASVFEAVNALDEAQKAFHPERYRHRAVLVLNKENRVVGKLSQHDIIKALEPKYIEMKDQKDSALGHLGFSRKFIDSVAQQYNSWDRPLQELYKKALEQKVKPFMHKPTDIEYVDISETINETIHRLIVGKHQSLLVTKGSQIVGIVRLTDVFELIHLRLKALHLAARIRRQAE